MSEPFQTMSSEEAELFMRGNAHPIREVVAERVGDSAVVDLGCGKGIKVATLYSPNQYLGVDCSSELVKLARRDNPQHRFVVAELEEWLSGIEDKTLETGIMISVLEHLPSEATARRLYAEARRACRRLYVGWHTPPHYPKTDILLVQAELKHPIYQNHYKEGTFDRPSRIEKVKSAELWTIGG